MKKVTILLFMLMVVFIGCGKNEVNTEVNTEVNKQPENSCVYNDLNWGTDRADVIAEKGEPDSYYPNSTLQYEEIFMGDDCKTNYFFDDDNKLEMIKVSGETAKTYQNVKDMFMDGCGQPISEEIAEDDSFIANWEVENTVIQLVINEEYDNFLVTYYLKTE